MYENFENFENLDAQVKRLVKQGHAPEVAQKAVYQHALKTAVSVGKTNSNILGKAGSNGASSEFDITITRATATVLSGGVAAILPVPIFGIDDFYANYNQVLNTLPVGVSISNVAFNAGNLAISYTDGTHTDIVTVSCTQYPYASFINALSTNQFTIGALRYTVFDTTQLTQYNNQFAIVKRGMFGTDFRDRINVLSYKKPEQFQNGIVDIGRPDALLPSDKMINVDQETTVVIGMNAAATFSINLSFFVAKYYKHNAG
jgi:hypothetical protein